MSDDFLLLQRVIDLEKKVEFLLAELRLADKFHALPPPADADVVTLARQGKLIDAIKLYREKHNAGLLEAKMAVEAMLAPARI
jgi:ribosomal protein L7/L12